MIDVIACLGLAVIVEGWRPSEDGDRRQRGCISAISRRSAKPRRSKAKGTVKLVGGCGDRATALSEHIWCEKIRGCSYSRGNTSV